MKCIRALDVTHSAQMSGPNKCLLGWILVAGEKYCNKKLPG